MSRFKQPIPTRYWLWVLLSAAAFVCLGFTNWFSIGKWPVSFWTGFSEIRHENPEMYLVSVIVAIPMAIPSIAIGWLGQACVGAAVNFIHTNQPAQLAKRN